MAESYTKINPGDEWPGGISDGITLPCSWCGEFTNIDYTVDDEMWAAYVPEQDKRSVVCLECLAYKSGGLILGLHLRRVQIVLPGGVTIDCQIGDVWDWSEWQEAVHV